MARHHMTDNGPIPFTPEEEAEWDANEVAAAAKLAAFGYQQKRVLEYPDFATQFDLLYHGGLDAWKAAIQVVKTKYPKP